MICAMTFWAFCMLNVMSSRSLRIPSICFVWSFSAAAVCAVKERKPGPAGGSSQPSILEPR